MDSPRKRFIGEVKEELYDGLDNMQQCIEEISLFIRGGVPGASRLKQVLSSIFTYFQVERLEHREQVLRACGLHPMQAESGGDITFFYRDCPCRNPFKKPVEKKRLICEGVADEDPD